MTSTQALRNTFVVFFGQIVARLLDLWAVVMIARSFGEAAFGQFSFAIAYVGYFAILTDLGFNMIFVRELVRDRDRAPDLLAGMLVVKTVLVFIAMGLAAALILIPDYPVDTVRLVWIMTFALLISPKFPSLRLVYEQVFQARLRMEIPMLLKLVDGLLLVLMVYGCIQYGQPLQMVMVLYVLSHLPGMAIIFWLSRRALKPSARFDRVMMKRLFRQALPVAAMGAFNTIIARIDVLFLSLWRGNVELGYYSAAYRLTEAFRLLPGAIMMSVYPLMVQASMKESGAGLLTAGLKPLLVIMIPVCIGVTFFSDSIIALFYTRPYEPAGPALAILIWTELGVACTIPMSYALIAFDRRKWVALITFVQLLINLALNVALIPEQGYLGAGMATALTEGAGLIGYGLAVRRATGWSGRDLCRSLLPGAVCFLLWMFVARSFTFPLAVASSVAVYVLILWLTRGVTRDDLRTFRSTVTETRKGAGISE